MNWIFFRVNISGLDFLRIFQSLAVLFLFVGDKYIHFPLQCFPFFGIDVCLLDESGEEIKGEGEGYLVFR